MSEEKRNSALKEQPSEGDGINPNHPARATDVVIVDAEAGVVTGTRKRIAICGFASSSRPMLPADDPTWEVWGLNQLYRHIPRADRWFDIHRNWHEETVPGTNYVGWLQGCGIPFYMVERDPRIPTAVRYPVERLIEKFGIDYFTSTIAYMLALAIDEIDQRVLRRLLDEEFETPLHVLARRDALYDEYEIGVFGVDLVVGEEYFWQKACAEYWLGVAASGRGIHVYVPPQSALVKQQYRYGYEAEPVSPLRLSELREFGARIEKERTDLLRNLYMRDGALQAYEHVHQLLDLRLKGAEVKG